jgi:hypothetical protein
MRAVHVLPIATALLLVAACATGQTYNTCDVTIALDTSGQTYWNGEPGSEGEVAARIEQISGAHERPCPPLDRPSLSVTGGQDPRPPAMPEGGYGLKCAPIGPG